MVSSRIDGWEYVAPVSGRAHRSRGGDGRRNLPDSHLAQRVAHGIDRVAHLVRADRADAADAKSLDLGELARIEDEALLPNAFVELLERILWIGRRVEGDDDRRLDLRIEEHTKPHLGHARDQRFVFR